MNNIERYRLSLKLQTDLVLGMAKLQPPEKENRLLWPYCSVKPKPDRKCKKIPKHGKRTQQWMKIARLRKKMPLREWYYECYLKSPLWLRIKNRILKRDDYTCYVCKNKANTVHHMSYEDDVLMGNSDNYLISLCNNCHTKIEFTNGAKSTLDQANANLVELIKNNTIPS